MVRIVSTAHATHSEDAHHTTRGMMSLIALCKVSNKKLVPIQAQNKPENKSHT
ncbi:hypothetical protein GW750_00315 [bacterium]|nr:hypothetical protein [bacterium]